MNAFPIPRIRNAQKLSPVAPYSGLTAHRYVAPHGLPDGDGSPESPFDSIETAFRAICSAQKNKKTDGTIIVSVAEGVYPCRGYEFTEKDALPDSCHLIFRGEMNGAVLDGGVSLPFSAFRTPDPQDLERLSPEVREHIRCLSLSDFGIRQEDVGNLCAIGAANTADKYDDGTAGVNVELFIDGVRMTLARYPNTGELHLEAVYSQGDTAEYPMHNYRRNFETMRNPKGGSLILDPATARRAASWKEPEKAWIHGYFQVDYADTSSRIAKLETDTRTMHLAHASRFGYKPKDPYYFYNILEELDTPGEWYLDRERMLLFLYPPTDMQEHSTISLSLLANPLLQMTDCQNVSFENFTFRCVRSDGIRLRRCRGIAFHACTISQTAGFGMDAQDCTDCIVTGCEVLHTGDCGLSLCGGDREHLIPSGNRIDNCMVHSFAEVTRSCTQGINLGGCGCILSHCEIFDSPTVGIGYTGNDHIIEYNVMHDLVLHASDAAAVYTGCSWTSRGTELRYNIIYNIGSENAHPDGIYWDDGMSGQTAYGNLLVNLGKYGFMLGGGNGHSIHHNIVVNAAEAPIQYDDRCRDALLHDGWAKCLILPIGGGYLWEIMKNSPYQNSDIWNQKYPVLAQFNTTTTDYDDPHFPANPAFSVIENNIYIDVNGSEGRIAPSVFRFSTVQNNQTFRSLEEAGFLHPENGEYILAENAPARQIFGDFPDAPYRNAGLRDADDQTGLPQPTLCTLD